MPQPAPPARPRALALREAFFVECRQLLHDRACRETVGAKAWACLASEGFDEEIVRRTPVGLLVDCARMRARLVESGFSAEEVRDSELAADPRLPGRLVGPIRDPQGEIVTFWARDPEDRSPRFLFQGAWKQRAPAVGLEVALPVVADGSLGLLLVEEIFDALLLHALGFSGVAAIGGPVGHLATPRWELLAAMGVGCVTVAPQRAPSTDRSLETALDNAYGARRAPLVLVLPPDEWGEYRSINDLVRRGGVDALCSALDRGVIHGYTQKAQLLLARHRKGRAWTEPGKVAAWTEAVRFYRGRGRAGVQDLDDFFVPPIAAELGIRWDLSRYCPLVPQPRPAAVTDEPRPARPNGRPRQGYCALHRCDQLACFCFD